jgi:hypothetical protein
MLCERGAYSSSLMLLASPLPLCALAVRLTARLDARISDHMDVLIRFFDPRIFEQLVRYLSADQLKIFLSAAGAWWYVDRSGELRMIEASFSVAESFCAPLILSERQEHDLIVASEPDQVAEQLRATVPNLFSLLPAPERSKFISDQMVAAGGWGITSTRDFALYCALALMHGPDFSSLPEWALTLNDVRAGKCDLTSMVLKLNEVREG